VVEAAAVRQVALVARSSPNLTEYFTKLPCWKLCLRWCARGRTALGGEIIRVELIVWSLLSGPKSKCNGIFHTLVQLPMLIWMVKREDIHVSCSIPPSTVPVLVREHFVASGNGALW